MQAPIASPYDLVFLSGVLALRPSGVLAAPPSSGVPGTSTRTWAWDGRGHDRTKAFGGTLGSGHAARTPFGGTGCALGQLPHPSTLPESLRGYLCRLGRIDRARRSLQSGPSLRSPLSISLHTETSRSRGAAAAKFMRKSRRRRAYPQQIVTTRLLYCLQDPFAHLSRLQRI